MLRNLENKGNPWGAGAQRPRGLDQGAGLRGPPVEAGEPIPDDVEYLFWVGCAGALDDRAKKSPAPSPSCCTRRASSSPSSAGRDLHRRPGPPDRQRVRLPDAGAAERRDAQRRSRRGRRRSSRPARTASTRWPTSTRSSAATTRSSTTPSCSASWSRRAGSPRSAGRPQGHLPRPVLPRPAQQGLHAAARGADHRPRPAPAGDAPLQGARLLLRRRRRPHVDGGEDRQADQRRAHRGGARPRPGRRLHRLPVLHHHAVRRGDREEAVRRGPASTSRSSTSPDPAALARRPSPPRRPRRSPHRWQTDRMALLPPGEGRRDPERDDAAQPAARPLRPRHRRRAGPSAGRTSRADRAAASPRGTFVVLVLFAALGAVPCSSTAADGLLPADCSEAGDERPRPTRSARTRFGWQAAGPGGGRTWSRSTRPPRSRGRRRRAPGHRRSDARRGRPACRAAGPPRRSPRRGRARARTTSPSSAATAAAGSVRR